MEQEQKQEKVIRRGPNKDGQFQPGQSGNPNGRPKNTWHAEMRDQLRKLIPNIVSKLYKQAMAGDTLASKILFERVLPAMKSGELPAGIQFSELKKEGNSAGDILKLSAEIINAYNADEITGVQAKERVEVLREHRQIIEVDVVQRQLDELKDKIEGGE